MQIAHQEKQADELLKNKFLKTVDELLLIPLYLNVCMLTYIHSLFKC